MAYVTAGPRELRRKGLEMGGDREEVGYGGGRQMMRWMRQSKGMFAAAAVAAAVAVAVAVAAAVSVVVGRRP